MYMCVLYLCLDWFCRLDLSKGLHRRRALKWYVLMTELDRPEVTLWLTEQSNPVTQLGRSAVVYVLSFKNNNKVFVKCKILPIFYSACIAKKVKECSLIFEKQKKLLYFISGSSHPIQPSSDSEANKHTNSKGGGGGGEFAFFSLLFFFFLLEIRQFCQICFYPSV